MLVFLANGQTLAQPSHKPIELVKGDGPIPIAPFASVLEDPEGALKISDLRSGDWSNRFHPVQGELEFGFTSSAFWLYFEIINRSDVTSFYVLDTSYPLIDSIEIHAFGGAERQSWSLGDARPYAQRSIDTISFGQDFQIPAGERLEFYVHVQSTSSLSIPFKLYHATQYSEHIHDHMLLLGLFYGIAVGLIAYNLFLYIVTRESTYIYYVAFCFSNACFSGSLDGLNYLVFPEAVYFQSFATYEFISLSALFALEFTRNYLGTTQHLPRLNRVIVNAERGFLCAALLVWFYHPLWLTTSILIALFLAVALIASSAIARIRQGYAPAKLFFASWLVLLSSIAFGVTTAIFVVEFYALLPYLYKLGASCEMILLSLALANRINTLKAAEKEALQEAELAKSSAKAKSEFLATMSHEIRTPINGVLGMTQLLSATTLNAAQANYVRTIQLSGNALVSVINDILDFSKLDSGKMQLEETCFDLEQVIDDLGALFALSASEQGIPFLVEFDHRIPKTLIGDPTRIKQILINLVGNAYKFTNQGEVRLLVHQLENNSSRRTIRFEISDTGVGISPTSQRKLFASFSQGDSSITRKYGGSGLGLAICKKLVEAMGGSIGVQSQPDEGSTFWFELPLAAKEASPSVFKFIQDEFDSLHHTPLALLGPPSPTLERLASDLQPCFDDIAQLATLEELDRHEAHQNHATGVVVVYLHGTDKEAYDTLQRIQSAHRRILVLVDPSRTDLRNRLDSTPRIASLTLPVARLELRKTLRELLCPEHPRIGESAPSSSRMIAPPDLRVLVAEDNKINQMVLKGMLKKFGIEPTVVNNGREAVNELVTNRYDLVFMDCEMPELDGYSATREIRQLQQDTSSKTTIFALTAHAMETHRQDALAAGMDDHFTKPISLDTIQRALDRWQELQNAA